MGTMVKRNANKPTNIGISIQLAIKLVIILPQNLIYEPSFYDGSLEIPYLV
jgi:hypothetical protein